MSVHYKFKSAVEYDTLPVDGLNISLGDLKEAIVQQKRLGKGQPYDLQITNAETKEVYQDEKKLIPKNSSLIVARVPIDASQMKRSWENKEATALILANPSNLMNTEDAAEAAEIDRKIKEVTDLTRMQGSESDKINAMLAQSTMEYHPSKYVKLRASRMTGVVPSGYTCYKCNQTGHWVTMCPLNNQDLRKSTGIPTMFLEEIKDASAPGVMITPLGKLVRLRAMSEAEGKGLKLPPTERPPPPEELECQLCKEMMMDAVLISCCAAAFCDDCIRNHLLESEDHECPVCKEFGIGPDTLIPNRYLRIKVQQYLCGCFAANKRVDVLSDGGESVSSVPLHVLQTKVSLTPPHSPTHSESPGKVKISDKVVKSPSSQTTGSPMPDRTRTPPTVIVVKPVGNGDLESDEHLNDVENDAGQEIHDAGQEIHDAGQEIHDAGQEIHDAGQEIHDAGQEIHDAGQEIHDAISDDDFFVREDVLEQEEGLPAVSEEKENMELTEEPTPDEKQRKTKKRKAKRKNSRHESEEEREEKKRRKKEKYHKSQDKKVGSEKKSKRHATELLKDVADLPEDKAALWDDSIADEKPVHEKEEAEEKKKKKKKSHIKNLLKDVEDEGEEEEEEEEEEKKWNEDRREESAHNRSRSSSGDKGKESMALYDNIVPSFNPHVPPPNFVKSSPKGYQYPVTSLVPQGPPPVVPVTSENTYLHFQPGLIADPLTEFERHMREKDERKRNLDLRYNSRSRSKSRSPRYIRRGRSRSPHRTWSRSPSRSPSRTRGAVIKRSPRLDSRRRWTPSPPPRGHTYRSRSPSYSREHSVPIRSLSLSRTPSPRRIGTSPLRVLPVQPPLLPDSHIMSRPPPPIDYNNVPRDFIRFPMGSLPHDQFLHQPPPPYHPGAPAPVPWDQHTRYNQGRPENFRGNYRGRRARGGFRHGETFNHRGQDFRNQDFRSQHMPEDRRGIQGPPGSWERDGRQNFNTEVPRSDRGTRHYDNERRRFGESGEYEEIRSRRHDETHGPNVYSDEEEWKSYSDDGRKREDEPERRRFDTRRRDDRKDVSDVDDYEEYKRSRKDVDRVYKEVDDSRPGGRHDREGKHRSLPRRDSPREDDLHYSTKSFDSPGKIHKKTPPKDRKDKEGDRRERDIDRRDRDLDRRDRDDKRDREPDRRDRDNDRRFRDGDRRDRDSDKRERDIDRRGKDIDRRDRDMDKSEYERKEKDYDRKDSSSYKRERDQDRKGREGDRRERETSKRERDSTLKDKSERDVVEEDKRDKSYVSRWEHVATKNRSDKEFEKGSKSQDRERSLGHEEKEHKRKSKRKEEKDESHHTKEKGDAPTDSENPSKVEKKKHDKKKKKKEKRRASQASTEASQGEASGEEGEDKKKKKKKDKKRKGKGATGEDGSEELIDTKVPTNEEKGDDREQVETTDTGMSETYVENESERTPDPKLSDESLANLLPMPPLSKWERDEELNITPKGLLENKEPEEEKKVTVDILKRAENTIFSGRGLAPRKVFLDAQKQKEQKEEEEREKERSPTPEWDRLELREAKRRGPSIQITISSKTESQIGRPRGGRHQTSSPEHLDDRRYALRSRRGDSDAKSERHSRIQKRSQSPSEPHHSTVKTRRRSERDHSKDEKSGEGHVEKKSDDVNDEDSIITTDNKKGKVTVDDAEERDDDTSTNDVEKGKSKISSDPDISHEMNDATKSDLKSSDDVHDAKPKFSGDNINEERGNLHKGIKRASSSSLDDLEVKKPKTEEQLSNDGFETSENAHKAEITSEKESFSLKGEPEYGIPVVGENSMKVENNPQSVIQNINSNLVTVPLGSGKGEEFELELEDGEIPSCEEEDVDDDVPKKAIVDPPLALRGSVQSETSEEQSLKDSQKIRYSPIRVPSPKPESESKESLKVKEKTKKRKKRKRSSSSSSSNSSSSSSSSSSSEDEEVVKKKKKKKKKKKAAVHSESSDGESQRKHKKKKKDKKKKKKKAKKKSDK